MPDLVFAALVPHPPVLLPAVGGEEAANANATRQSMERLAAALTTLAPDTVVIISPHGPVFSDAIAVHRLPEIGGSFASFGAPQVAFTAPIDEELGGRLIREMRAAGVPSAEVTREWAAEWDAEELDHGTMVPLSFLLDAGWRGQILPVAIGMLPPVQLYAFGQALQRAIDRTGRRTAILASGDLSHCLSEEAPEGFCPEGAAFDRTIVEALGRGDLAALFGIDPERRERAAECGYRPLLMMAGALDGLAVKPLVYSYEHPFGVGYAVVALEPGGPAEDRRLRPVIQAQRETRLKQRRAQEHPLVQLARAALEHYVKTGLEIDFSAGAPHEGTTPWRLPESLPERAGCFVTLSVDGDLRGCMGTMAATEPTLALEVVRNAVLAGTGDPRFSPVEEEELPHLEFKVDLLGPLEPAAVEDLDPAKYGIVVRKGEAVGLLLPDLPGIERVEQQVEIACRKAGLEPGEPGIELQRFTAQRLR